MRQLGVGLIYLTEVDPLFREVNSDLAVLELEPETFWDKLYPDGQGGQAAYQANADAMSRIASLPHKKLVHSVGFPVGGTERYAGDYIAPLAAAVRALDAAWASAHLSFNTISTPGGPQQVGLLLPPRQTREGVALSARNIRELAAGMGVPLAFETGVNYLQPRRDELSDGAFFAGVAKAADCGILLDLHNLWANERNGRQPVEAVLDELPLDRVWEMHLAGGMLLDEYYLDAHSGAIAPELLDLAGRVIPRLPNLGALMFEIQPGYFPQLGLAGVRLQLTHMNELWRMPRNRRIVVDRNDSLAPPTMESSADVRRWEATLGTLAVGHSLEELPGTDRALVDLADDPAIGIFRKLVAEARSGLISRALHYSTILMLASWGPAEVQAVLDDYQAQSYPDTFASGEADRFATFLRGRLDRLPPSPYLQEVLRFEHALLRAALYGERATVQWEIDPVELFDTLEEGRVPAAVTAQRFAMEIVPQ